MKSILEISNILQKIDEEGSNYIVFIYVYYILLYLIFTIVILINTFFNNY